MVHKPALCNLSHEGGSSPSHFVEEGGSTEPQVRGWGHGAVKSKDADRSGELHFFLYVPHFPLCALHSLLLTVY